MTMLIAGIVLWSITHLLPAIAPGVRANLVGKFGASPYKGLFALDIIIAVVLIVFGWKAAVPASIYAPPLYGSAIPMAAIMLAIVLLVASSTPNNLRRYVRHPQMTAVLLWGVGHLLQNGDSRSIVLFGGLTIWALLEMILINKRDGQWQRPDSVPFVKDIISGVIATAAIAVLIWFHATLFGVPPIPG